MAISHLNAPCNEWCQVMMEKMKSAETRTLQQQLTLIVSDNYYDYYFKMADQDRSRVVTMGEMEILFVNLTETLLLENDEKRHEHMLTDVGGFLGKWRDINGDGMKYWQFKSFVNRLHMSFALLDVKTQVTLAKPNEETLIGLCNNLSQDFISLNVNGLRNHTEADAKALVKASTSLKLIPQMWNWIHRSRTLGGVDILEIVDLSPDEEKYMDGVCPESTPINNIDMTDQPKPYGKIVQVKPHQLYKNLRR